MQVRRFKPEDAHHISSLFKRSVLELGRRFYSQKQVMSWAVRGPAVKDILARNEDGRLTFVSVNNSDHVMAYAELEADGHIDHVYALPEVAGTGVVSLLYDELERQARLLGIQLLYTVASEGARRFFLKKGFTDHGRRDFDIEGVSIHNYHMDKTL